LEHTETNSIHSRHAIFPGKIEPCLSLLRVEVAPVDDDTAATAKFLLCGKLAGTPGAQLVLNGRTVVQRRESESRETKRPRQRQT
jgi:hypothetical protein